MTVKLTPKRRAALTRLIAGPLTLRETFGGGRNQMPALLVAGWAACVSLTDDGSPARYAITEAGRAALSPPPKDGLT